MGREAKRKTINEKMVNSNNKNIWGKTQTILSKYQQNCTLRKEQSFLLNIHRMDSIKNKPQKLIKEKRCTEMRHLMH